MMNVLKLIFSLLLLSGFNLYGQQTICLGNDTDACVGSTVSVDICGGGVNNTVYNLNNPTSYVLSDDSFTGIINLGFNFTFYGNTYNQIVVGDNGVISFNTANANGYCSWVVDNVPSNTNSVHNSILAVWQDILVTAGGTVYYQTLGTAPNRVGVIFYDGVSLFDQACQTPDQCFTGGILLFEGSNRIETHLANKTSCAAWGSGTATHGLNNIDGTIGQAVPGRNNTVWTAQNDAWEFVPTSPTNYAINQIPYGVVTTNTTNGLVWMDTQGNSYPYNNGVLDVTVQSGTVGYFLASSTCNTGVGAVSDTSFITGITVNVAATGTDDFCTQGIGEATASATGGGTPYTYQWDDPMNQTGPVATGLYAGTYTVTATDVLGCQGTATVTIGDTPITLNTTYTQVSCPGGNDGTATVTITPTPSSATYDWYDAGNQTTATATGLSAGTYNVAVETALGCQDTATVTVDEIPAMNITLVNSEDVTCNSGNDGIATIDVTGGTQPYTFSWTNSSSTSLTATDLYAGVNTVVVTDGNGCVLDFDVTIGEPAPLGVESIKSDTTICVGDSALIFAQGAGGSSPYIYTWRQNGNVIGNTDSILVSPSGDNAEYCVTLTEQCGSPSDQECLTITFPEEVEPMISPDITGACVPVEVNFENVTNTAEGIAYTVWNYDDGKKDTISGTSSVIHTFRVGLYDISVEVVSDRGCSYKRTFNNLIEGYSNPEAAFYVNPNPASIFEPEVDVFSQSSGDVISYQWFAEGADPEYSTAKDPTFVYPEEIENYPLILVVENENGCVDSVERLVRVQNEVLLFTPNTFTPDGDGVNENWRVYIQGVDIKNFHLEVFNRWGEIVFESYDPEGKWDGYYGGRKAMEGVYIWKIQARDAENDNKYEWNGHVTLIR